MPAIVSEMLYLGAVIMLAMFADMLGQILVDQVLKKFRIQIMVKGAEGEIPKLAVRIFSNFPSVFAFVTVYLLFRIAQ